MSFFGIVIIVGSLFLTYDKKTPFSWSVLLVCVPLWIAYQLLSSNIFELRYILPVISFSWLAVISWKLLTIFRTYCQIPLNKCIRLVAVRLKNICAYSLINWALIIAILAWFGVCSGLQILTPMDNMEYWQHLTLDQSICAINPQTTRSIAGIDISSGCNWYYWSSQLLMSINGPTLTYSKASLLVGISLSAAALTTGELVLVASESKLAALSSQLLFITTFGWYGFSYIQANGLNGMLVALACAAALGAIFLEKYKSESRSSLHLVKRLIVETLSFLLTLCVLNMCVTAHGNMILIFFTLGLALICFLFAFKTSLRVAFVSILAVSILSTSLASVFRICLGIDIYPTAISDPAYWNALIDTHHFGYYTIFSSRFFYYLPPWMSGPYDEVPISLVLQLLLGALCLQKMSAGNIVLTRKVQVYKFFAIIPFVTLSICLLPPLSDALIRNFPGDPNCYYRWLWGSLPWIGIPVLGTYLIQANAKPFSRLPILLLLAAYGIVSLIPIDINGESNIFRARTVHLFERNNSYRLSDIDHELLPVLVDWCGNYIHSDKTLIKPTLYADSYLSHYLFRRTCAHPVLISHRQFWPVDQDQYSRQMSLRSNNSSAAILILRRRFKRFSSPTAAIAGHWNPKLDYLVKDTFIYRLTDQDLSRNGFKLYRETSNFLIYAKR